MQNSTIIQTLEGFLLGQECMGFRNGYYIIKDIIQAPDFDQFINEMIPPLLNLEHQVFLYQLGTIKDPNVNADVQRRVRVLMERRNELAQPLKPQNKFIPKEVEENIHTD